MTLDQDTKVVGKAYKVEIDGRPVLLKSYSGGRQSSRRGVPSRLRNMRPSISELTLQVYVTVGSNVLSDAAHKIANLGKDSRFKITIWELGKDNSVVKTFVYDECLLTSLDYPTMSSTSSEILCQTATFKPQRLDVS